MNKNEVFAYTYSAAMNKEVQAIRRKYLPQAESGMEELRRLDHQVQSAGMIQSMTVGILGCLIFGLGMCLTMRGISDYMVFGTILGLLGMVTMLFAYPVYRMTFLKEKEKYTPRILELVAELSGENMITK